MRLEDGSEVAARAVVLATGAEYRRLPVADLEDYEGISIFYAAGPPEAQRCGATRVGVVGGGNSAAQAAVWLARGGALVTLLHRRADLRETMSDYLIASSSATASRCATAARSPSCTAPTASSRRSRSATASACRSRSCSSSSARSPCTDWLGDAVARDDNGFVLTGADAGAASCSRPASPASTPPATCARAR